MKLKFVKPTKLECIKINLNSFFFLSPHHSRCIDWL